MKKQNNNEECLINKALDLQEEGFVNETDKLLCRLLREQTAFRTDINKTLRPLNGKTAVYIIVVLSSFALYSGLSVFKQLWELAHPKPKIEDVMREYTYRVEALNSNLIRYLEDNKVMNQKILDSINNLAEAAIVTKYEAKGYQDEVRKTLERIEKKN